MTPQLTEYLRLYPRLSGLDEALRIGDAYRLYHGMHCSLSMGVALERTCGLVAAIMVIPFDFEYESRKWLRAHADCFVRRPSGECGWEIRDERAGIANGTIQQLANVRIGCGLAYLVRAMDRCGIPLGSAEPIRACLADALAYRMKADEVFVENVMRTGWNDKASYLIAWGIAAGNDAAYNLAARYYTSWFIRTSEGTIQFGDRRAVPPYGSWSTQKCGAEVLMMLEWTTSSGLYGMDEIAETFRRLIRRNPAYAEHPQYAKYPNGTGGYADQWCDPSLWFMHPMLRHEARECAEFLAKCETDSAMKNDPTAKALWGDSTRMLIAACAM